LSERVVIGEFDWNGVLSGEASYKRYDLRKFAILPDGKTGYLVSWDGGVLILLDLLALRATDIIDLNPALGAEPVDIVITPDGAKAYVSVWGRFTPGGERHWVGVIDTQTNQVIKQIRIGGMPRHMDINPDGQFVYVASSPFVYVIDTQIDEVAAEIIVSGHEISLNDVAVEPNQNKLYVAYTAGDQPGGVFVVDLEAGTVIGNIAVKWRPNAVAVSQDGSQLYVNCILGPHDQGALAVVDTLTDEVLSVIDPPQGANEPEVGTFTSPLALTSDGKHIYWTTGWKWVNVVEADTNRILRTLDVEVPLPGLPIAPSGIAFISDLSMAYISCLDAGFVASWDIEEGEFAAVMRVGFNPTGIVVTADDQNAYVINMLSEDISVIDLNTHEVVEVIQLTPPPLE
jgi:YVTN family beta-propeller protein